MLVCLNDIKAFQRLCGKTNQRTSSVRYNRLDLGCGGQVQTKHDVGDQAEHSSKAHEFVQLRRDCDSSGQQNDSVDICEMGGIGQSFISLIDVGREGVEQFTNRLDQEEAHGGVEHTVKHLAEQPV